MNQFKLITFKDGSLSLDVRVSVDDGTIWLSVKEMAELFGYSKTTISRHVSTTYNEFLKDGCAENAKMHLTLLKNGKIINIPIYSNIIIEQVEKRLKSNNFSRLLTFLSNKDNNFENDSNIIKYNNGTISLDVNISPNEETAWLTQAQIATLFDTTRPNVTNHIQNIFVEGELTKDSVSKDFLHTAPDGKQYLTSIYNLDMILAIGYRVKGKRAIEFRKWVTAILKNYLIKGYAINESRIQSHSDIILNIEKEILQLKEELKDLKVHVDKDIKEKLFIDGQIFDAYEFFCSLMKQAKNSIKIIDPYFDDKGLAILSKSNRITRTIYLSHPRLLNQRDIDLFKSQYGDVTIKTIQNFHDRFIIIDDIDCYLIGASLNNAGSKTFAAVKIDNKEITNRVLELIDD